MSILLTIVGSLLAAFALAAAVLCFSYLVASGVIRPQPRTRRVIVFEAMFLLAFISFQYHRHHQIPWLFIALFCCIVGRATLDRLLASCRRRSSAYRSA